jgi:hypothetical protein
MRKTTRLRERRRIWRRTITQTMMRKKDIKREKDYEMEVNIEVRKKKKRMNENEIQKKE